MIEVSNEWKKQLGCYSIPNRPYLVPMNDIKIEYGNPISLPAGWKLAEYIENVDSSTIANTYIDTGITANFRTNIECDVEIKPKSSDRYICGARSLTDSYTFYRIGTSTSNSWFDYGGIENSLNSQLRTAVRYKIKTHVGLGDGENYIEINGNHQELFVGEEFECDTSLMIFGYNIGGVASYPMPMRVFAFKIFNGNTLVRDFVPVKSITTGEYALCDRVSNTVFRNGGTTPLTGGADVPNGKTLTKSGLLNVELNLESDLLSFGLPDDSLTFEIDNVDGRWNPDNPTGDYASLSGTTKVELSAGFATIPNPLYPHTGLYPNVGLHPRGANSASIEWKKIATMFIAERDTPQNGITATFTARNILQFMTAKYVPDDDRLISEPIGVSTLMQDAFAKGISGVPTLQRPKLHIVGLDRDAGVILPYKVEKNGDVIISYEYDFDYSCAEIIQLVANAFCCIIRCDENGDVWVEKANSELSDYFIDQFVSYQNSEYQMQPILKMVDMQGREDGLTDKKWNYLAEDITDGEVQSISNPFIQSSEGAMAVGQWVNSVMGKRKVGDGYTNGATISGEYRADIRLQPTDVITNRNKYATNRVSISRVHYTYSGAWHGEYEGRVTRSIPNIDLEGAYYSGDFYANGEF